MSVSPRLFAPVVAALVTALLAPASATIGVSPIRMTLNARAPINVFTITNNEDAPKLVKASLFKWEHEAGVSKLSPSTGLLISPPVFTIQPHDRQVIRAISRKRAGTDELAYRLIVEEAPLSASGRVGMNVTMKISVPIFVAPDVESPQKLGWTVQAEGNERYTVSLDNVSNKHVEILAITLSDGKTTIGSLRDASYIFPGEHSHWTIAGKPGVTTAKTVTLEVQTDVGEAKLSVPVAP